MTQDDAPVWKIYGISWLLTALILGLVLVFGKGLDIVTVLILAGLEITFSFDNAVVNAKILQRMSRFWQNMFMTVGIVIAVFGVRILLPIILVSLTASLGIISVISLALHNPTEYAARLTSAHPMISAFGGTFLLMIFLDFMFQEREIKWLQPIENTLLKVGKLENVSIIIAVLLVLAVGYNFAPGHEQLQVITAGLVGLLVYQSINALDAIFSHPKKSADKLASSNVIKAGLVGFLYLELIDASFSLDGVIGAFAITNKIIIIAAGLGIGALYVRSLTVHMLRRGMLNKYRYMEHGAHYAIGILALLMLTSIRYEIPEAVTGLSGVAVIVTAIVHSHLESKKAK